MTEYIVANGANAYTPVIKPMLVPVVTKGFMAVMNWKDLTDQLGVRWLLLLKLPVLRYVARCDTMFFVRSTPGLELATAKYSTASLPALTPSTLWTDPSLLGRCGNTS
jgi:hypothetical protein